jgi:predicted AAA+ superfamily ATPase
MMSITEVMVDTVIEQKILRLLYEQNTWWVNSEVSDNLAKPFLRRDFFIIKEKLNEKEITTIMGPRQVGKTTVLYQLIKHLINEEGIDPKRILYTSFDYPYLTTITQTPINDLIETYTSQILQESLQSVKKPLYIFFDEVCKLGDWSQILKGWYDLKYPIKFVISDSSSSEIIRGSSESLVGRIDLYTMLSLKFIDYLLYFENKYDFNKINWDLRDSFRLSLNKNDPKVFFKELKHTFSDLTPFEKKIELHLRQFVLKDGYPELLDVDNLSSCRQKLRDYLTLTIYKDLMRIFDLRDPKALEELITLIAAETSQRMEITALSSNLSMKRDTVVKYLDYLEMVFLISKEEFYTKSRASRIRKTKKIFFNNVGLRNAMVGALGNSLFEDLNELGKVVESLVHEHSKRLKYCLEPGTDPELYYWKTDRKEEVDIVMEINNKPIPIEVKYRSDIPGSTLKGIKSFQKNFKCPFGVVVTRDVLDLRENLVYVPLWLYLIMC